MHSFKKSKFFTQRPGSSARTYETENSDYDTERKSRIPRLPKRTCSLEGNVNQLGSRQSQRNEGGSVSMIPRLEWRKGRKKDAKPSTAPVREKKPKRIEPLCKLKKKDSSEKALVPVSDQSLVQNYTVNVPDSCIESRLNENFINFKTNVLRIPEYWTDAGRTVTSILKNAVSVVAKKYPTADVEAFEIEIQNILKATETVKHQILAKTEDIIKQANKIYVDRSSEEGEPSEEELERLTRKMDELRSEVHAKKNIFEDMLKCGSEMTHLMELDKELRERVGLKGFPKSIRKDLEVELEKINDEGKIVKRMEMKKSKMVIDSSFRDTRRKENVAQSCGDVLRQDSESGTKPGGSSSEMSQVQREDKFTQTINLWTAELHRRNEDLATLNNKILELHQLCKDHISKFKSFNLQIKLRGLCNKAQHTTISKELQLLNDEKMQLAEKNNKLQYYSKDLETAIRKKNLDLHQKDRVICQQKRLLHVRDELIEMLKTKCNVEMNKV